MCHTARILRVFVLVYEVRQDSYHQQYDFPMWNPTAAGTEDPLRGPPAVDDIDPVSLLMYQNTSQRAQYGLIKTYTLNHTMDLYIIQAIFLN